MYSFDFLLDREPFADDAEQLLLMIALNDIKGFITVKSLMDIHYVLKHVIHDEEKVRSALSILLDTFWLVNSNAEDAINALTSKARDYEDALMIETAISCHSDCIITRNTKDYCNSAVKTYEPQEFLRLYQK
ncbi:MAG: PIN domain-containing protein [Erysipelotrichaceae bacterium]|nr:PIN domain-containing protein [Erysipelotrichaceae bacterium]